MVNLILIHRSRATLIKNQFPHTHTQERHKRANVLHKNRTRLFDVMVVNVGRRIFGTGRHSRRLCSYFVQPNLTFIALCCPFIYRPKLPDAYRSISYSWPFALANRRSLLGPNCTLHWRSFRRVGYVRPSAWFDVSITVR